MKITDVESFILRLPEVKLIGDALQDVLIIRIHTDEGITGIGEAHTNPFALKAIIDTPSAHISAQGIKDLLVGEDPTRISHLWDKMYRFSQTYGRRGLGIHAISGIDIALWDIAGQVAGQPIHRLLGGARRSEVRTYASDLAPPEPEAPEATVDRALAHVATGFKAVKFGWGALGRDRNADLELIRQIRAGLGPDIDILIDIGLPIPLADAVWYGEAFADERVFFLEEPLAPDDFDGWRRLVATSPTPIATGEKETTRFGFRDLIERGNLRIIQPDVARAGGITECMRIGTIAELGRVQVIPHCWSTDILVAATLHFIATVHDCPYLEFNATANPLKTDLAADPIALVNGIAQVPTKPGLGIELREDTIKRFRIDWP